jgi:hypothetical protein
LLDSPPKIDFSIMQDRESFGGARKREIKEQSKNMEYIEKMYN